MNRDPFLTIVTRHLASRETEYEQCKASINAQTDQDIQHLVIEDSGGRGIGWANSRFEAFADRVRGEYVFILDDDDELIADDFVAMIRDNEGADLIIVRMAMHTIQLNALEYIGDEYLIGVPARDLRPQEVERLECKQGWSKDDLLKSGLYEKDPRWGTIVKPTDRHWEQGCPPFAYIGISSLIVKREVWLEALGAFEHRRNGDYPFYVRCFELAEDIVWLDRIMSRRQDTKLEGEHVDYLTDYDPEQTAAY